MAHSCEYSTALTLCRQMLGHMSRSKLRCHCRMSFELSSADDRTTYDMAAAMTSDDLIFAWTLSVHGTTSATAKACAWIDRCLAEIAGSDHGSEPSTFSFEFRHCCDILTTVGALAPTLKEHRPCATVQLSLTTDSPATAGVTLEYSTSVGSSLTMQVGRLLSLRTPLSTVFARVLTTFASLEPRQRALELQLESSDDDDDDDDSIIILTDTPLSEDSDSSLPDIILDSKASDCSPAKKAAKRC
eukprot:m.8735 g.8735  ORF g.8735 m.8735 type:complete len:244 (-) comp9266_c0_seq1:57-788(-)